MTFEARAAVAVLGILGVLAVVGVIILAATDHDVPDLLSFVIGAAVSGVTGILVPSAPAPAPLAEHHRP
jgi:hypothetical protein